MRDIRAGGAQDREQVVRLPYTALIVSEHENGQEFITMTMTEALNNYQARVLERARPAKSSEHDDIADGLGVVRKHKVSLAMPTQTPRRRWYQYAMWQWQICVLAERSSGQKKDA